jgi:hypothetical protein
MQEFQPKNKGVNIKVSLKVIFALTVKIWDSIKNEARESNSNLNSF